MTTLTPRRHFACFNLVQICESTDDPQVCIIELLADIRHWCLRNDESFEAISHFAYALHLTERTRDTKRPV